MTDVMDFGCAVLRMALLEQAMAIFGYFGRAWIAIGIIVSLFGYGYLYNHRRSIKVAVALIVALVVSAAATELLKYSLQLPRPRYSTGYGFSLRPYRRRVQPRGRFRSRLPASPVSLLSGSVADRDLAPLFSRALLDRCIGRGGGRAGLWYSFGKEAAAIFLPGEAYF
jgi:hypothetical protein